MLQFEGVTLVAALLHQIRRGFAERVNNVAAPLVYEGELFCFHWPAITLTLIANHCALTATRHGRNWKGSGQGVVRRRSLTSSKNSHTNIFTLFLRCGLFMSVSLVSLRYFIELLLKHNYMVSRSVKVRYIICSLK